MKKLPGIDRATEAIIKCFLDSPSGMYSGWVRLSPYGKERIRRSIRSILRHQLLGEDFLIALATDTLRNDDIASDSAVFHYIKRRLYKSQTQRLLKDMQAAKEGHFRAHT
jgi:hypothetical protein